MVKTHHCTGGKIATEVWGPQGVTNSSRMVRHMSTFYPFPVFSSSGKLLEILAFLGFFSQLADLVPHSVCLGQRGALAIVYLIDSAI